VCGAVAAFPGKQWIRWGHEMEDPSDRYPWACNDPAGYVAAYRYFVETCGKIAREARFIWSPKGEKQLAAYYPGDAHVDMVGVAVWGLERWDHNHHGRPRSFADTFAEKYRRVAKFGKPVIIAELGIAGGNEYRSAWLSEITRSSMTHASFPLLTSIVYFNDQEPHFGPQGFGSPDWSLSATAFGEGDRLAVSSSR
jgi:beta-mannanase